MVLHHALCAVNVASAVLANGVCCFYDMKKEEERKQEQESLIRQSIHSEWERQRFMEMIERQEERDSLKRQEARRINLMETKHQSVDPATKCTQKDVRKLNLHTTRGHPAQQTPSSQRHPPMDRPHPRAFARNFSRSSLRIKKLNNALDKREHRPNLQVFTDSTDSRDLRLRNLSSLMDDCEDENEFEEVHIE
jgi:hypothetical protein